MKRFIIFIIILVIGGGAFVAYKTYFERGNISLWTLVPDNALAVYESTSPMNAWAAFTSSNIGKGLQSIAAFKRPGQMLSKLDTILGGNEQTATLFNDKTFLASLHSVGSQSLDFLLLVDLPTLDSRGKMDDILAYFSEKNGYTISNRTYQGYTISELRSQKTKDLFTFIYYKNFFIGSFTPFLVEDAVRNIETAGLGFFDKNIGLLTLSRLQNDQGNLYINTDKLDRLGDTFLDEKLLNLKAISTLGSSSFLDVKVTEPQLLMNGFTLIPQDYSGYFSGFINNPAQSLKMEEVVSNRTAVYFNLTFESAERWNTQMLPYWQTNEPELVDLRSTTLKDQDIDIASFFESIGGHIGVSLQESSLGHDPDKVVYMEMEDLPESLQQFKELSERINKSQGDTLYYEEYADFTIGQLEIDEFPYQLFGEPFSGFSSLYYTGYRNYLIGAASVQILKTVIDDITNENTWGKSVQINSFLDNTLREANFSVFVHTPRAWNLWQQNLDDAWKQQFTDASSTLQSIDLMAIQWSFIEDKFYTSIMLQQTEKAAQKGAQKPLLADNAVTFAQPLISKPFVVRNHNDKTLETLVQDSTQMIYLLSANQEVLWLDSIKGKIISPVFQIDYYKNGKLQYLFSTPKYIYAIDRTGEYLPGFPVEFKGKTEIAYFNLVDYDKSKNYRYFFADTRGDLYISDKDGKVLEGWNPKEIKHPLASSPLHIRVRGQDFLVALQSNGIMRVFNRRAQPVAGFPVDFKAPVNNPVFAEAGSTNANSKLTTITDDGSIIQINLAGKVLQREQLYRPSAQSKFKLVPEASGNGYIFTRQDANRIAIVDQAGKVLFEKDYMSSGIASSQFYDFGGGRKLFIVNDPVQAFSYLYDEKGNLVNFRPAETMNEVAIVFYESQGLYKIYKNYENEFSILTLKK
ncbi:hypothetical protein [uncultured Imperialibacter sp.]|uniref:hypothetical protein n=1 Tax=uncultured Imperialibacter sp. TaxID=1672639 RepID=UPI0030DD17B7